ncbi:hypothetical protein F2Q69_00028716 [Brassica cretica]|uniref:Uncharacterized protein n=1 Tax=Brassica cretica TaxID=69181 RepID=A0A8S9SAY9_BRACR|nr:hypothetical protein F2Q69_00028716 [Brassica cretica]
MQLFSARFFSEIVFTEIVSVVFSEIVPKFHVGVIAKLADSKFVWSYWFGCMNPSQCSESFLRMKMAEEIFDEKGVNLLAQFDA